MIFLTVGTSPFPFYRLIKAVDTALVMSHTNELLVAQIGNTSYQHTYKHVTKFTELSFKKMLYYMTAARVVICHGGIGSILISLQYGKVKPIIVPRLSTQNEHINDHQIPLCEALRDKCIVAGQKENVTKIIFNIIQGSPPKQTSDKMEKTHALVTKLTHFTETMYKDA